MTRSKLYALLTAAGVTVLGGGTFLIAGHDAEMTEAVDAGYLTSTTLPDGGVAYRHNEGAGSGAE